MSHASRGRDDEDAGLSYLAAAALKQGRASRVIDFPGMEGVRVAVVCPNEAERTEADVESRKRLTKGMGLTALELTLAQETELVERERDLDLLALVLRHPDDVEQTVVDDVGDLRKLIGDHQRKALVAAVRSFERERYEARTPEEGEEVVRLVRSLKASGAVATFVTSSGGDTAVHIIEALCDALDAAEATPPSPTPPSF